MNAASDASADAAARLSPYAGRPAVCPRRQHG